MLSINPKMLPRLDELEADLLARRQRAIDEGWRGEVEGLDLTLGFLSSKRAQAHRAASMGRVDLGMPTLRAAPPPRRTTSVGSQGGGALPSAVSSPLAF
ncbi:hypothetical protein [Streptomyces sp. KR55]|uniref:hypothetical protein n=1 Tax=Streptomyces sp. KR55 TaxID=3457425 RepID=UPI003FD236E3